MNLGAIVTLPCTNKVRWSTRCAARMEHKHRTLCCTMNIFSGATPQSSLYILQNILNAASAQSEDLARVRHLASASDANCIARYVHRMRDSPHGTEASDTYPLICTRERTTTSSATKSTICHEHHALTHTHNGPRGRLLHRLNSNLTPSCLPVPRPLPLLAMAA
jgi:hypothetical protein